MNALDLLTVAQHSQCALLGVHPTVIVEVAPATLSLDPQHVPRGFRLSITVTSTQGPAVSLTLESWPTIPPSRVLALREHEAVPDGAGDCGHAQAWAAWAGERPYPSGTRGTRRRVQAEYADRTLRRVS